MAKMEEICFIDPSWLAQNVLSSSNALEYFSSSPFYDKTCNNEVLKMQSKFREVTQDQLHNMVGIEYALGKPSPVITIEKLHRHSSKKADVLAVFYIVHGYIYQAPRVQQIYSGRLANALFYLYNALDLYRERRAFDIRDGFRRKSHDEDLYCENDSELQYAIKLMNEYDINNQ